MKKIATIILFFLSLFAFNSFLQKNEKIYDLQEVIRMKRSETIQLLKDITIDSLYSGDVPRSVSDVQLMNYVLQAIRYYENKSDYYFHINTSKIDSGKILNADAELKNQFKQLNGKYYVHPTNLNGRIDWSYSGPNGDPEWAFGMNRHIFIKDLLYAFRVTHDTVYLNKFNSILQDWLINNITPSRNATTSEWRVLEAGIRMDQSWPYLFYVNIDTSAISRGTKLLMLLSISDHAGYIEKYHRSHHNHALMEMNGLASISTYWPEFNSSNQAYNFASDQLLEELKFQILPDGVQNELTMDYHFLAIDNFERFITLSEIDKRPVNPEYLKIIESMYSYIAYCLSPNGKGLNNNDSDRTPYKNQLLSSAKKFNRQDIEFIATNGNSGISPKTTSVVFPYAGHVILRNGYQKDAQWMYFDVGPYGNSHQHNDKLHVSLTVFGKDFLVDAGRYYYKPDKWRQYFKNSFSHNVLIVDNNSQNEDEKILSKPISGYWLNDTLDIVRGTFDKGYMNVQDPVIHTRTVYYFKSNYWIIKDVIRANESHNYKFLWHFYPDIIVKTDSTTTYTDEADSNNLLILPWDQDINNLNGLRLKIERGLTGANMDEKFDAWKTQPIQDFDVQGWYSSDYGKKQISSAAIYETRKQDLTICWIIIPYHREMDTLLASAKKNVDNLNLILSEIER